MYCKSMKRALAEPCAVASQGVLPLHGFIAWNGYYYQYYYSICICIIIIIIIIMDYLWENMDFHYFHYYHYTIIISIGRASLCLLRAACFFVVCAVRIHTYAYVCIHTYTYVHRHRHIHVYMDYMHMLIYTCMRIYIYIYIYIIQIASVIICFVGHTAIFEVASFVLRAFGSKFLMCQTPTCPESFFADWAGSCQPQNA